MAFMRNYEDGFKLRSYGSHVARLGGEFPKRFVHFEWVESWHVISPNGVENVFADFQSANAHLANERIKLVAK